MSPCGCGTSAGGSHSSQFDDPDLRRMSAACAAAARKYVEATQVSDERGKPMLFSEQALASEIWPRLKLIGSPSRGRPARRNKRSGPSRPGSSLLAGWS